MLRKWAARTVARLLKEHYSSAPDSFDSLRASGLVTMGRCSGGEAVVHVYEGENGRVIIGDFTGLGAYVEFLVGGGHRVDWISTFPFRMQLGLPGALEDGHPITKGDIVIGHNVWIARSAKILSGVTIGNGAVVAAYSVVTRDVRPYAIVAGNPAREVRRRFSDEQIEALEKIRWNEWPMDKIIEAIPLLCSPDVEEFIRRYGDGATASGQPNKRH
jgi:acetyltransferase-like isoleucine patch superfamily enzyme